MSDDGFEYEDDYGSDAEGLEVENLYYQAEDLIKSDPQRALAGFINLIDLENAKDGLTIWGFKALTQAVLLRGANSAESAAILFRQLLQAASRVTRNEATEGVTIVLDSLAIPEIYELALEQLGQSNWRLWFSTGIKYAKLLTTNESSDKLPKLLASLQGSCLFENGSIDSTKTTQLLEVLALQLEFPLANSERRKIHEIAANLLNSTVSDPKTLGVVKETGGLLKVAQRRYAEAYGSLLDAFMNFQECGEGTRARKVLRWVVLSGILSGSNINPFDTREAKAFLSEPETASLYKLRLAWEAKDLAAVENVLTTNFTLASESSANFHLCHLVEKLREDLIVNLLTSKQIIFPLSQIAQIARADISAVITILNKCVHDNRIQGEIDLVSGFFQVEQERSAIDKGIIACGAWADAIKHIVDVKG